MSRTRLPFKKSDVKRAVSGVEACGLKVAGVEIDGSKIRVLTGEPQGEMTPLAEWRARRGPR